MNKIESETLQKSVEVPPVLGGIARRRLLRAGIATVPVALAVSGRSAMATVSTGVCAKGLSPLAWNSLAPDGTNCRVASHTVQLNTLGVSHGNWKPNGNNKLSQPWPTSCVPFSGYTPGMCSSACGTQNWASGTKFNEIFSGNGAWGTSSAIKSKSVSRILLDDNGTIESQLCAAYLNAATVSGYAMTLAEVQKAYDGKVGSLTLSDSGKMQDFLKQTWS
jgi:hypothetical protein